MALANIPSDFFIYPMPIPFLASTAVAITDGSTYVMDASGEHVAISFRAPKTGNLRKFAVRLGTISNAPDNGLRFSFQDITATPGGGILTGGPDQSATIASGGLVASAWNDPGNFDTDRAVTAGDNVAAALDFPTFVAGDSLQVATLSNSVSPLHPYYILNAVKQTGSVRAMIAVMYDDNTWFNPDHWSWPITSITSPSIVSTTAVADEYGMSFSLPGPSRCVGMYMWAGFTQNSTGECLLYEGTTVRRTATKDTDHFRVTGTQGPHCVLWDDGSYDLVPNVTYTIAYRPTSAFNAAVIPYGTFPSAAVMGAAPGGMNLYLSRRLDQGAWQHYNNDTDGYARPFMSLLLSAFDDGNSPLIQIYGG